MPTPLPVTPEYFLSGAWVTAPVLAEDGPVKIERGYTDEGTLRPSSLTMRINDSADPSLNPSRPTSPLYAINGRSLPVRVTADSSVRASLEVSSLDPDETQSFTAGSRGVRWLDVEAGGPLWRIGQWSDDLQAPMTRVFAQFSTLIGFWPGDDAALSTRVGLSRAIVDFTLADTDAPDGASGSFVGTATSRAVFSPLVASTTAGFQVFFCTRMTAAPPVVSLPIFQWRAQGLLWSIEPDTLGVHLKAYNGGALADDNYFAVGGGGVLTDWTYWRAKCYQSGGNVVCEMSHYQGGTVTYGVTQTFAATIDRLTSLRIDGNTAVTGTHYAQVGALTTVVDDLVVGDVIQSYRGYRDEKTTTRFLRLCRENGVSRTSTGVTTTTMGIQRKAKLIDLLKEVAATEDGLIFDQRDASTLIFKTRRQRQNQTSALTLAYGSDIVPPFKERLDNVGVQNTINIEDISGAVATAVKTTGPMAATAYPAGIGVFKGGAYPDVDVSLADPVTYLPAFASWLLARGTVPGPRFPTVSVEVGLKSPGLRAAVLAVDIGDRITVTGRLPDPIDLQVIGITEKIGTHTWDFTFTCIPNDVFNTGGEDSAVHLLDTYANTIITAPSPATTGTSMVVGSADDDDVWSTTSLPYPIIVAGEKMTVTAATAPTLVSGTYRQTLTVTRSVNGVVKAQVTGTAVHVFQPIREAY